jgi:hypothetical protein
VNISKQIYTKAKIIMTAASTLAIIIISILALLKEEKVIVPEPKIIIHPTTTIHDTHFRDSLR